MTDKHAYIPTVSSVMPHPSVKLTSPSRNASLSLVRSRSGRADRAALEVRTMQGFRTVFGAARKLAAEVRRIAKLSSSQLWALSEVAGQSGITVNGLAERMALHQTTTSNLVNMLVERKLVRRLRDVDDQRVVHLQATGEGRRMLSRVPAPHCGILVDALKRMPAEELRALGTSLRGLVAKIRTPAPAADGQPLLGE